MLSIISPAKSLNFRHAEFVSASCEAGVSHPEFISGSHETLKRVQGDGTPEFAKESEILLGFCKKLSVGQLQKIMGISEKLAELNYQRFQGFDQQPKKAAAFAYDGDVYDHLDVKDLGSKQIDFLQAHALIVSGFYGLLKPLDYIRPYRLEMSTKLPSIKNQSLYEFWQEKLTNYLNNILKNHKNKYLINLASGEYSKAINQNFLELPMITINFKELRNGKLQTIGLNAKKARGMMLNFIVNNFIDTPEELKSFKKHGYEFSLQDSTKQEWVFMK